MLYLKILAHPVLVNLNFHFPMIVDVSHPLIMLAGENGCGKSTLLHSLYYAFKREEVPGFVYRAELGPSDPGNVFLFDAEVHNPRNQLGFFENQAEMQEFLQLASHGQVMLTLFRQSFPALPRGSVLLLDEPEMALSQSNQRRVLKMMMELVDQRDMRVIAATHSPVFLEAKETYVINLDRHTNKNVIPSDLGVEGQSTLN
jgi:predicted ATPase